MFATPERKQQALDNLKGALGRLAQEGFEVEIVSGGDTAETSEYITIIIEDTHVTNLLAGESKPYSFKNTFIYSPKK